MTAREIRYGLDGKSFPYHSETAMFEHLSEHGTLKEGLPYFSREAEECSLLAFHSQTTVDMFYTKYKHNVPNPPSGESHGNLSEAAVELLGLLKPWALKYFGEYFSNKVVRHNVTAGQFKPYTKYWVWPCGSSFTAALLITSDDEFKAACVWAERKGLVETCDVMVRLVTDYAKETKLRVHRTYWVTLESAVAQAG